MAGKRALVVYDTRYGATEQIANWIAEGINDADIRHVDDVDGLNYDLIVVGCPIYNEMPGPRIIRFLDKNKDFLKNRKLALFTVSVPFDMTPDRAKRFAGQKDVKPLFDHVAGQVIASKAFLGKIDLKEMSELDRLSLRIWYFLKGYPMRDMNYMDRDAAIAWGRKLLDLLEHPQDVVPPQPRTTDVQPYSGAGEQVDKK
ncbi:MAG TPA: flavodoxin domain-containing protein [Methanocella sp.]|nr:flavodoxin domain-containing protein [Methanocella sp.]